MHPSTAQAEVLVDELVRNGVRHVVLAPGSRNAPLSFALHRADRDGRLRLHVRIDERSAGFLALGIGKRSGEPAAVVCTSGTAAANLHPAVSEAHQSGVPLIALTADRPPELRAARANQTIEQDHLYGGEVRHFAELGVAEERSGQNAYWRSEVCRARGSARAGPVHLNLPFREPLVPGGDDEWCESLEGRVDGRPWTSVPDSGRPSALTSVRTRRGLVLLADDASADACAWAERHGWPVLSEAGGAGITGATAIGTGMWLLGLPEFVAEHKPEQIVCVGRPTVFRQVQHLLADADIEVLLVHEQPAWPAPAHDVREVAEALGEPLEPADSSWLTAWQQADQKAAARLDAALDLERWPNGPALARDVVEALPTGALLALGSSNPTRDVALAAHRRTDLALHRNRGAAGIDGTVSTALGAALAHDGPAYALVGDLTFLHDANGLLIGPQEQRPDLTIVVYNDDGGGIFSLLEQGGPEHADSFERVFGTPHGTSIGQLCAAHGVDHAEIRERGELVRHLAPTPGVRVIEIRGDRANLRGIHERLRAAIHTATHN